MKILNTVSTNFNEFFRKRSLIPSFWIKRASKFKHYLSLRFFDSKITDYLFNKFCHRRATKRPVINCLIMGLSLIWIKISAKCFMGPLTDLFISTTDQHSTHVMRSFGVFFGMVNPNVKTTFAVKKTSKIKKIFFFPSSFVCHT